MFEYAVLVSLTRLCRGGAECIVQRFFYSGGVARSWARACTRLRSFISPSGAVAVVRGLH